MVKIKKILNKKNNIKILNKKNKGKKILALKS